jgi:uncharacterized membrane protein
MTPRLHIMKAATAFLIALAGTALEVHAGPYLFTNFDGPNAGNAAGAGTNANGINNNGAAVGFTISNDGNFHNFIRNPNGSFTTILANDTAAMAFGINNPNTVVGVNGLGQAFELKSGGTATPLVFPTSAGAVSSMAFGINDKGTIVGQYTNGNDQSPGFILDGANFTRIDAPAGPDVVNAQGINNNGQIVGYYVGNDGNFHGFMANEKDAKNGQLTGIPIADPTIPNVPGEPGATFVFSQILGINDQGIAVGYYGDSTLSQHGFIYNTKTGQYTFLDDPSEQFNSAGVEVTQITGINNAGEITGFYSDANGVLHGFVASPAVTATPEPASLTLLGIGLVGLAGYGWRRRKLAV